MHAALQTENSPEVQHEVLVLCTSALQLPISLAEQLEFLSDAIDGCDWLASFFEWPVQIASDGSSP